MAGAPPIVKRCSNSHILPVQSKVAVVYCCKMAIEGYKQLQSILRAGYSDCDAPKLEAIREEIFKETRAIFYDVEKSAKGSSLGVDNSAFVQFPKCETNKLGAENFQAVRWVSFFLMFSRQWE